MAQIQTNWNETKTKGSNGENAVQFLINQTNDWECVKYGVENLNEQLKNKLKDSFTPSARKIKSMPDFVAIHKQTKQPLLIESKYRKFVDYQNQNEVRYHFAPHQIKTYKEFWPDALLIIAHHYEHKPCFVGIMVRDIDLENHFRGKFSAEEDGRFREAWNFKDIQKDIKSFFPTLKDEDILKAKKLLPDYDGSAK